MYMLLSFGTVREGEGRRVWGILEFVFTCAYLLGKGGGALKPILRPIFFKLSFVLNILFFMYTVAHIGGIFLF